MSSPQTPPSSSRSPAPSSQPTSPSLGADTEPGIPIPIPIDTLNLDSPTTFPPPLDEDIYPPSPSPSPTSPSSSNSNNNTNQETYIEGSEIPRLRATHTTAGYRDGISASKAKALQPGFDEGYPLGATFGLRVGWVLGVLEGVCGALGAVAGGEAAEGKGKGGREREQEQGDTGNGGIGRGDEKGEWAKAYEDSRQVWRRAREELAVERLFGREFWGADGVWRYDVQKAGGEGDGEEVTFQEVVEQHPLVKEWVERARGEMKRWGIREGVFEGEEWERGRIGNGEGEMAGG